MNPQRAARYALSVAALVPMLGCGDGSTGPSGPPDVRGTYVNREQVNAVTCTPQRPPAEGGTVILDAFSFESPVRVAQQGSKLEFFELDFPNEPPLEGTIDNQGALTLRTVFNFQEEPRAGNRIFFVNLTYSQNLQRAGDGSRLVGNGSYVNVFREGSPTAAVFATCSRTSTIELTRTGP